MNHTQHSQPKLFSWDIIKKGEQELLIHAANVRSKAQAPYSKFCVGAAVLSEKGNIYIGCNVERCTFTQTTHAEQNAIDTMIANEGSVKIQALAIVGAAQSQEILLPPSLNEQCTSNTAAICGQCLQIIWENCFNDPNVPIVVLMGTSMVSRVTIGQVLPVPFGPTDLGIDYRRC